MNLCTRKFLIFTFYALSAFCCVIGQGVISGVIRDEHTGQGLEFATVFVPEQSYFTETDATGKYSLKIPALKNCIIKVSRVGYKPQEKVLKDWKGEGKISLDFNLKMIDQEEVIIRDRKSEDAGTIREKGSSFELLPTVSGQFENILPSIGLGVRASAGGELSSQYSVRGGSYDENLVYVNDFEIFRPQLIRNGQQEGLSFPNPDLIRELSFSSGGFEARYGDKQSSVLDIKYKIPDSLKYSFSASFLGIAGHLEGSAFNSRKHNYKRLKYLVGARYKTNQYLLNSQDIKGEYQPDFLDIQSYLSYDFNPSWQLSWIGNINRARFSLIPESSTQAKGSFFFVLRLNTFYEGKEESYFNQSMTGISLLYFPKRVKNPYYFKWISSLYQGEEAEQFDVLGYYRLVEIENDEKDQDGREVKLWGEGTQHLNGRNYLNNWVQLHELRGGYQMNNLSSGNNHFIQYGGSVRFESFDDKLKEWERIDSAGYSIPLKGDSIILDRSVRANNQFANQKYAFWLQDVIQWAYSSKNHLHITPGLRAHYNQLNNEFLLSPRLKFEFVPLGSTQNIRYWISTGLYPQVSFYREMRDLDGNINSDLKAQKSFHLIGGFKMDFLWPKMSTSRFRWISEIYYKKLWDVVSYDLDNVRIRYSGLNDAQAYAIGWDNRINGEFVSGAESWVNLSFLRTRESLNGVQHLRQSDDPTSPKAIADVPRPTDQLFALSLFFQDYLPKNKNFKMHMQTTVASGLPYGFREENEVYRNAYRFKPYHRVDIGFSALLWDEAKRLQKPHHVLRFSKKTWVSVEVFNLLKVKNEASVRWIKSVYNYQFAIPNYLTSRRINLRLRIEF